MKKKGLLIFGMILLIVGLVISCDDKTSKPDEYVAFEVASETKLKEALGKNVDKIKITLTADITVTEPLTVSRNTELDLQDKTITYTAGTDVKERLFTVKAGKTLTVGGIGKIEGTEEDSYGLFDVSGKLIINGGTFETVGKGIKPAEGGDRGAVIRSREGSDVTINGGTVFAKKFDTALYTSGKAELNNGVIKSNAYAYAEGGTTKGYTYAFVSEGETMINGGEVCGIHGAIAALKDSMTINNVKAYTKDKIDGEIEVRPSFYALYIAGEVDVVNAKIKGGEFVSESRNALLIGNSSDGGNGKSASITIEGGKFESRTSSIKGDIFYSPATVTENGGKIIITGGTFKNNKAIKQDTPPNAEVELSTLLNSSTHELKTEIIGEVTWYKVIAK